MKKNFMIVWVSASSFVPILLSIVFALSANLLQISQLQSLFMQPIIVMLLILLPAFSCLLFMRSFDKWLVDIIKQKENRIVQASLQRILYEHIAYSIVSFLILAFLLSYSIFNNAADIIFIFLIYTGVMMTTYALFYFGILVRLQRYLYSNGFLIQFESTPWNQNPATAVAMALSGIFITTTLFVYMISKTIGSAITLYDVLQRALVVIVVIGVPLVMLILMLRQFYFQQINNKQLQLRSLYLLLEKLYGNLELTDAFLEDMVATVGQVIGAKCVTLGIFSTNEEKERVISVEQQAEGELSLDFEHMRSSLEVPVMIGGRVVARFCLSDKIRAFQFTKEDEEMMMIFSRAFAVALQNSYYVEELKKERKVAQEAASIKSQILSTMSHELRTPLNAIIGYSDILIDMLEDTISEKQITNLKRIKESGRHLLRIINDILDLSKMEAGQMTPVIESIHMQSLLQFCMHNAQSLRGNKPVNLYIQGDTDIWIKNDEQKLKQIIMNLVSNAIKFTEQGSVTVHFAKEEKDIVLIVEDTGIGIPPEHQTLIFEPFKQIDGSLARKYKGTGLGLSIVARLVSILNGTIRVESEREKGSRFIVRLEDIS
jgi:signal transduction histidine kinase